MYGTLTPALNVLLNNPWPMEAVILALLLGLFAALAVLWVFAEHSTSTAAEGEGPREDAQWPVAVRQARNDRDSGDPGDPGN